MRKLALVAALSLVSFAPRFAEAQVRVVFPGIRVAVGPPAPRYEPIPVAPSPRHQWIAGYWGWRGGAHVWITGHWALPPVAGYAWEPAHWEQVDGTWMFYDGHWRAAEAADPAVAYQPPPPPVNEVVVESPPPAPIEEVRPAVPFAGAVWVGGYWHWNGERHVWVGGRWTARPAGYEWEQHRWEHRDDGRWVQRPGYWRAPQGDRRPQREERRGEGEHR